MTATSSTPRVARPTGGGVAAAFKLAFATVATRGRLVASVLGVIFFVALALILRTSVDLDKDEALGIALGAYLVLLLPMLAVSTASVAFGSAVQDSTLVYVWLRPIARWKLAVAHVAATVAALLPMIIAFSLAIFVFGPTIQFVGALLLASVLMAMAYAGPVVALGTRFKRASMMAITYVILVETILGGIVGIARISVRSYGLSVFANLSGQASLEFTRGRTFAPSTATSIVVLALMCAAGVALTTWFLKKADVA